MRTMPPARSHERSATCRLPTGCRRPASHACPARAARASPACAASRSSRSSMSTPSRWSISCRNTRPEQLVALDDDLVAVEVEALHGDDLRAHDLEREAGQRQAALLVDPLARRLDDLGVEEHVRAGLVVDVVDEEPLLHPDLRRGETRRPGASYIVSYIASTSFTSAPSISVTGAAGRLSTGSPKSADRVSRHRPWYRPAPPAQIRGGSTAARTGRRCRPDASAGASASASASQSGAHERPAVGRARTPARRDARRPRRSSSRSGASSPESSASAPNGGNPSMRRSSISASATSAGSAVHERLHDHVVGHAGLERAAASRRADAPARSCAPRVMSQCACDGRAVPRREQLLVEVEVRDERRAGGGGPTHGAARLRCR